MYRFNSVKGYLIYPHKGEYHESKKILEGYEKKPGKGEIIRYGVNIPQNISKYDDFKKEIKKSEDKLKEIFAT